MCKVLKCPQCGTEKHESEFDRDYKRSTGYQFRCKQCNKDYRMEYRKTIDGMIGRIYSGQKGSSKKRGAPLPSYTKEELKQWMFLQVQFGELYDAWIESGCKKELCVSVDRIDSNLPYTLDNIQLCSWKDNRNNYFRELSQRKYVKHLKAVIATDSNGVDTYYESIIDAEKATGVASPNISTACKQNKISGGYYWRYNIKDVNSKIIYPKVKKEQMVHDIKKVKYSNTFKAVIATDSEGYDIHFDSVIDAEKATGVKSGNIVVACKERHRIRGGYKWRYATDTTIGETVRLCVCCGVELKPNNKFNKCPKCKKK